MNRLNFRGLKLSHLVAAICFTMVATAVTFAQGTRGTISGEITDPNGAAVAGATVRLINTARNQEVRTATADEHGYYQILEVDPATYELVISAKGFVDSKISNVTVEPNRSVRLEQVQLGVTGATATVEVTAAQELVDR